MAFDLNDPQQLIAELIKINESFEYFCDNYGSFEDKSVGGWGKFVLWEAQKPVAKGFEYQKQVIVLKARQLGLTWLALNFACWLMITKPGVTVLLFSLRDVEAKDLLVKLKGIYSHLPKWLRALPVDTAKEFKKDDAHDWKLSTDSQALAFSTKAGDSYTAALAIIDEADLVPNLNALLKRVQPTVDAHGQLFLISKSDKSRQETEFKAIYRAAMEGENSYTPYFLPWYARPDRTLEFYEAKKKACFAEKGNYDDLHENYPATDQEALIANSTSKRIPAEAIAKVFKVDREKGIGVPLRVPRELAEIPKIRAYALPTVGCKYGIGADPAAGNPNSDDSAAIVMNAITGEEVCTIAGKFDVAIFGRYLDILSRFYNRAGIMVERNNHGAAVILWIHQNTHQVLLCGLDNRIGWMSSTKGKTILYDSITEAIVNQEVIIHTPETSFQLGDIASADIGLKALEGKHDDFADAFALAWQASLKAGVFSMKGPSSPEQWAIRYDGVPQFGAQPHRMEMPMGIMFNPTYSPFGIKHDLGKKQ